MNFSANSAAFFAISAAKSSSPEASQKPLTAEIAEKCREGRREIRVDRVDADKCGMRWRKRT